MPQPWTEFDDATKKRLCNLRWPQLRDVIRASGLDVAQFAQTAPPAEHILTLEDQLNVFEAWPQFWAYVGSKFNIHPPGGLPTPRPPVISPAPPLPPNPQPSGFVVRRAAILIGVDRAGSLPTLHATAAVQRMRAWAVSAYDSVAVFTDEPGKPVRVADIKAEIFRIQSLGTCTDLLIYFSGHGIVHGSGEFWLLSDAPTDANAAVNVQKSARQAAHGGIPYVVMISDACRTAARGLDAQNIEGSQIFPNVNRGGPENAVDLFYASGLGEASHEFLDPHAAENYEAIYTSVLLEVLHGHVPPILEIDARHGKVIRTRPLKDYLKNEVPRRIAARYPSANVAQQPDAHITSGPTAYLAKVP